MPIVGYVALLKQIRSDYPASLIVGMCEPFYRGSQCSYINSSVVSSDTGSFYVPIPKETVTGYGCDGHPDTNSHINIADSLIHSLHDILFNAESSRHVVL
jgi:hypothetical protein